MRTLSALGAVAALLLTAASLPVVGGVPFALFLFFPLFLLGLLAVIAGLEKRTVRQHNPSMSATGWRDGPAAVDGLDRRTRDLRAADRRTSTSVALLELVDRRASGRINERTPSRGR
jgi:hypothetical protein